MANAATRNRTEESERKLRELILYISLKSEGDPAFGAVKLNKILFLSDFLAYSQLGRAITGAEYMRLEMGPAPRRLVPLRDDMVACGEVVMVNRALPGLYRAQQRLVALRAPDLSVFGSEEIALVDSVIDAVRPMNGTDLSTVSHEFPGWLAAETGETIPYETALISSEPPTEADIQRTREMARQHGW